MRGQSLQNCMMFVSTRERTVQTSSCSCCDCVCSRSGALGGHSTDDVVGSAVRFRRFSEHTTPVSLRDDSTHSCSPHCHLNNSTLKQRVLSLTVLPPKQSCSEGSSRSLKRNSKPFVSTSAPSHELCQSESVHALCCQPELLDKAVTSTRETRR